MTNLKTELKSGEKKVAIWGLGYIGYSSMSYFAREGIYCLGTDVVQRRVDEVNQGKGSESIPNMEYWLGFDVKPLSTLGLMKATTDYKELISEEFAVHLVTIPTEMDGKPYADILVDVMKKISDPKIKKFSTPPLVIIESTITPTMLDKYVFPILEEKGFEVGKDILLGVAPRRDWFVDADKTLKTLPRVVGGSTPETTKKMAQALGIICETVLPAKDHLHASLVKSVENAYRHLDIAFANQLSLAYPDLDTTEILKLAGTKWNVGTYHPSFGTGGYCIPLAPQYVLNGAKHPEELTLLSEALKTDFAQPIKVAKRILKLGAKKVGVLGIAYTGDLKVHILSPSIKIVQELVAKGIDVKVNDPYYSSDEIKKILGVETFNFPEDLDQFDALLIATPHRFYKFASHQVLSDKLKNCKLILDNMGVWKEMPIPDNVVYKEAGTDNWLED